MPARLVEDVIAAVLSFKKSSPHEWDCYVPLRLMNATEMYEEARRRR